MKKIWQRAILTAMLVAIAWSGLSCKPIETADVYTLLVGIDLPRITVGETAQLTIRKAEKNGEAAETPDVVWQVDDQSVATINGDGVLSAVAAGKVKVHAHWPQAEIDSNTLTVEVTAAPKVYALTVAADKARARIDQTVLLSVTQASEDGAAADKPAVEWHIADGAATVSESGVLAATDTGTVTAYAVWNGVRSNTVAVEFYEDQSTSAALALDDERFVSLCGRNVAGAKSATLYNTASACEVAFRGRACKAKLSGSKAGAKLKVYINGEAQPDPILLSTTQTEYTLAEGRSADERTTVKFVKVNSANKATVTLHGLQTDGTFVTPPPKPALKLEFYGDSITCGYGVEGERNADNVSTENGTVTYAYRTAERLNAAADMLCYSGISVALPHTGWSVPSTRYMANVFGHIAPAVHTAAWDFTRYQADVIVVNLGTNDASALNAGYGTVETFVSRYVRFVQDLRLKTPGAAIVLCYGMMGTDAKINTAIASVVETCGLENVYYLQQKAVSRTAYNGHPDLAGHASAADELVAFLNQWIL